MRTAPTRLEAPPFVTLGELASPKVTLALMPLLAIAVIAAGQGLAPATWTLAAPLLLLAVNLAAAIATSAAFRTRPALLAFHAALLAIVVLAALGRLTYLNGTLELSEGEEFAGALATGEKGPWHAGALEEAAFTNLGFSVEYEPGMKRSHTANRIAYRGADGRVREATIGDDTPLKLAGYRFYTTPNKGFAPEFAWRPAGAGAEMRGTVHLPSFPSNLARQETTWTPPGAAAALSTRLRIDERIVDLEGRWRLRAPAAHALEIESGGERWVMHPGETRVLRDGTLRYVGLRMWMGYQVSADWTLPWILAASLAAAAALAAHYASRFTRGRA